jgi:hypothetical protein
MKTPFKSIWEGRGRLSARTIRCTWLAMVLLLTLSTTPARAAETIVVGDGTPESCTEDAFVQAMADVPAGGAITFNCGPNPVTIWTGAEYVIDKDLTIDGGGLVTLTGGSGYLYFLIPSAVTVNFLNFTITEGGSECEGAISNYAGILTLRHVTVSGNSTGHGCNGGGISNGGTLTIEDSIITGNRAGCWGYVQNCGSTGGIDNYGSLYMANSTVSNNWAAAGVGGIWNSGMATIENSTISGNSTLGSGGGIYNDGTLFLQNTTIANNTAYSGGGLANENSTTVQNSILAGNTAANSQPSDCSGTLTSQGYNLIGSTAGCTINGDTTGDLLEVDALLGPLQDNNGPTLTHAPLPGSPAIDTGNPAAPGSGGTTCEATDQRGVTRPQDGDSDGVARCDIGAVEVESSTLIVQIDIKPGDSTNPINLKSKGVIPVAILSSSTFDATMIDPASVTFGPNDISPVKSSLTDVNGDGLLDLLLHFSTQQTGLQAGNPQACLTGHTQNGTLIEGCDNIRIVP